MKGPLTRQQVQLEEIRERLRPSTESRRPREGPESLAGAGTKAESVAQASHPWGSELQRLFLSGTHGQETEAAC